MFIVLRKSVVMCLTFYPFLILFCFFTFPFLMIFNYYIIKKSHFKNFSRPTSFGNAELQNYKLWNTLYTTPDLDKRFPTYLRWCQHPSTQNCRCWQNLSILHQAEATVCHSGPVRWMSRRLNLIRRKMVAVRDRNIIDHQPPTTTRHRKARVHQ
jgi:hypothetical protein